VYWDVMLCDWVNSSDILNDRSALVFRVKVSKKSLRVPLFLETLGNIYTVTESSNNKTQIIVAQMSEPRTSHTECSSITLINVSLNMNQTTKMM
jgi:hypothetical protein